MSTLNMSRGPDEGSVAEAVAALARSRASLSKLSDDQASSAAAAQSAVRQAELKLADAKRAAFVPRTPETALENQQQLSRRGEVGEGDFRQRLGLSRHAFLSAIHAGTLPAASGKDKFGKPTWSGDVVDTVAKLLGR
jgi:hypothetical protein